VTQLRQKMLEEIQRRNYSHRCPDFCVNDKGLILGMGSGEGVHGVHPKTETGN